MKYTLFYILLFLNITFCYSQNENNKSVDSLYNLINTTKNIELKINHYKSLCNLYSEYDIAKLEATNNKLLTTLQKTKKQKEYAFYYRYKALVYKQNIDLVKAITFYAKAKDLFYKQNDWDSYILCATDYAMTLSLVDKNNESIAVLNSLLLIANKTKNKNLAYVYFGKCYVYNGLSNYAKALENGKKALELKSNLHQKNRILYIIAYVNFGLGKLSKATEYINIVEKKAKHSIIYYKSEYLKALILIESKRYREAINIFAAISLQFKIRKTNIMYCDCLYSISECYYQLKNYDKAIIYLNKSIAIGFKGRHNEIGSKTRKAKIYLELNELLKAKKNINECLILLKETDYFEIKFQAYDVKQKLEEKLGNYKTALLYTKKIMAIKDEKSINNNKNKLQQLEVDLDVTEKNNRIKNLQIAQLKKQVEITTKNSYLNYSILLVISLLLLLQFFIRNQKIIKNKNRLIGLANIRLDNEKSKTQKSLQEKETLLKEIHHRVKNNMQLVISLLKIQARDTKQLSIENFIEISENRIRSMALVHEYLYESENINYVNFEEYVKRLSRSIMGSFSGLDTIKLETEINKADFTIETSIPLGLIINELVINAYKHAFVGKENGIIKIKLFENEGFYHLEVSDNGVGFGDNNQNVTSIGLKIVKLLVSQINGSLRIKNESGTSFVIQFTNNNQTNEQ